MFRDIFRTRTFQITRVCDAHPFEKEDASSESSWIFLATSKAGLRQTSFAQAAAVGER